MERRERRLRAPSMGGARREQGMLGRRSLKLKKNREKKKGWDIYSHPQTVLGVGMALPARLWAGGTGGALQRGLGEAACQRPNAGVGQRGGGEEFVPARHGAGEVELLQDDLSHAHEALAVHAPVVTPHDHLWGRGGIRGGRPQGTPGPCSIPTPGAAGGFTCRTLPWGLSSKSSACWYEGSQVFFTALVFFLARQTPFSSR